MSDMAGRHPAQDVLADLAAEVLEEHEARVVEAHVIGCARCADLLADAERVRQLLLTTDPGPMPAHVWDRIAGALAAETAPAAAAPAAAPPTQNWITQEWPVDAGWVPGPEPEQVVDAPTGQWERFMDNSFDAVVEDRPADADRLIAAPVRVDGPAGRVGGQTFGRGSERPLRRSSSLRSRRDVRTESRSHALVRYAKPLGIAAGIIAVAGLAGVAVVRLPLGGDVSTSSAAGSAAAAADQSDAEGAFAEVFQATGTDYTKADIAQQALRLTQTSAPRAAAAPGGGASASPAASARAGGTASGAETEGSAPGLASTKATMTSGLDRPQTMPSDSPLTDPKRLAECLAELNAPGQNPIAVDLARFEGKEAAIIVLAGRDGGYEVWAVDRSCHAGDSGLFSYTPVPPS